MTQSPEPNQHETLLKKYLTKKKCPFLEYYTAGIKQQYTQTPGLGLSIVSVLQRTGLVHN